MAFNGGLGTGGLEGLISRSPVTTTAAILFVVLSVVVYLLKRPKRLNLPVVGKPGCEYYGNEVLEGATKVSLCRYLCFSLILTLMT
jgi:hypothetical protein